MLGMNTRGWAQLPSDLLLSVLEAANPSCGSEHDDEAAMLNRLKMRLRWEAVCTQWRAALEELPVPAITIRHPEPRGLVKWLVTRRPRVQRLHIDDPRREARLAMVLYTLGSQDLQQLHLNLSHLESKYSVLPTPAAFRALTELHFKPFVWSDSWLEGLTALPNLQHLHLGEVDGLDGDLETMPRLPRLTSLAVHLFEECRLRVALANLPSLQRLDISGALGGFAAVETTFDEAAPQLEAPPSALTYLRLYVAAADVDFAAMPVLRSLELRCPDFWGEEMASATALKQLVLERHPEESVVEPSEHWGVQVLDSAPRTLRCLTLRGDWPVETAAAVGSLCTLRVLCLDGLRKPFQLPREAPVWRGLRALRLTFEGTPGLLPLGLVHSKELERLELHVAGPTKQSVPVLASLSSLRHLWLGYNMDATHIVAWLRGKLPHLQSLRTLWTDGCDAEFMEPAVALAMQE